MAVPWAYEGAARDLILALKLRAHRPAASVLGRHLAAWIQSVGTGASAVTWVPGRKRDTRIRGFDHAELIGREVGRRLGLPVVRTLRRTGARPDQTTLSASERRVNLQGAFGPLDRAGPLGRYDKLLLVDDLVTTGATAAACARALKDGGTTHVEVAAPCRA